MQNKTKTLPRPWSVTALILALIAAFGLLGIAFFWVFVPLTYAAGFVVGCILILGFARLINGVARLTHELCWLGARVDAGLPFPVSDQPSPPPSPPSSASTPDGLTKSP